MPVGTRGPDDPPYVPGASPEIVRATQRLQTELARQQTSLESAFRSLNRLRLDESIRRQAQFGPSIAKQLQTVAATEALRGHTELTTRIANQMQATAHIGEAIRRQAQLSASITAHLERQLRLLSEAPIAWRIDREFAAFRANLEAATSAVPAVVPAGMTPTDALEVGHTEGIEVWSRWRALPLGARLGFDLCLMTLLIAVGRVVDDFHPNQRADTVLDLLTLLTALHALLAWHEGTFRQR
jgi:hypothetical protein